MDIEYDPAKDAINLAKHGLSLADAAAFDLAAAIVVPDDRKAYGEARCLAFTIRGSVLRIISYRRAHEKEMRIYGR